MQQAQSQIAASPAAEPDYAVLRQTMVDRQIRTYDVHDPAVIARFLETPREKFVLAGQEPLAYSDFEVRMPLAAGGARSLLAPLVAARALQALEMTASDRALVVGDGPGYLAALIAGIAESVVSLESDAALSAQAGKIFASLGVAAKAVCAPLAGGASAEGPFDVILIAGAAEDGIETLLGQLADGGRLLAFHPQAGAAGRAAVYRKIRSNISASNVFEAQARLLPEFARKPGFRF